MDDSGKARDAGEAGEVVAEATNKGLAPVPAELQYCSGYFSGAPLTNPRLCTSTERAPCNIIRELFLWNEILSLVRLELREEAPGKISMVPLDNRGTEPDNEHQRYVAFTLVYCLLKDHRCVAAAEFPPWDLSPKCEQLIASGLRSCQLLKTLKLGRYKPLITDIAPAIPFLTGLEEFECELRGGVAGFIEVVCSLLKKATPLRALSLWNWKMTDHEARLFWEALSGNDTLTALSINSSCLMPGTVDYSRAFAYYLQSNSTLETLSITTCMDGKLDKLSFVVNALRLNKSLLDVCLRYFFVDNDAAAAIASYLTENSTLRSFILEHGVWYEEASGLLYPRYDADCPDTEPHRIRPWIRILQNNRSLREFRLKLVAFTQADCVAFFEELAQNSTLSKVIIEDLHAYCLRRSRCAPSLPAPEILSRCKQANGIHVSVPDENDLVWFNAALRVLLSSTHLTTVKLEFSFMYGEEVATALSQYIAQTRVLMEFLLDFCKAVVPLNAVAPTWKMTVFKALQQNTSVRKLLVKTGTFSDEEADLLADVLRSSKSIHTFVITSGAESVELLGNHLSPGFSDNFTLVSLNFRVRKLYLNSQWFAVKDVVLRNSGLVTRAAYFVAGKDCSRQCIEALEPVEFNPALRERVCTLAPVSEQEAGDMVRASMKSLQSMDDFFRAAGVVKKRVACYRSENGSMQLVDLNEDAWLCLRKYLRIAHVLHDATTGDRGFKAREDGEAAQAELKVE